MRPAIAVTTSLDSQKRQAFIRQNYIAMVEMAGGCPVLLPPGCGYATAGRILDMCDGLLLTGGDDVNPALYGEMASPKCGGIEDSRDALETAAIKRIIARGRPVLGICRGIQMLNVALGGSLYQDLPSQVAAVCALHEQGHDYQRPQHAVMLVEGAPLSALLGVAELQVNSSHHQAVKRLAPGLKAMAYAPEGFIEAAYMPGAHYVRGVQWHPEYMVEPGVPEDERAPQLAILRDFIDACAAK